jgi:hypothetical protein
MTREEIILKLKEHLGHAAVRVQDQLVFRLKQGDLDALSQIQELDNLVAALSISIEEDPDVR